MSEESAFNLKRASEEAYVEPSGVLDQLNLHPSIVSFLRKNKKIIQIVCIVFVILVVTISLYKSYRESQLEKGASNLDISMEAEGTAQKEALAHVETEYANTPSGSWATVELAHLDMKEGAYAEALKKYQAVRDNTKTSNPLYALLTYGIAQAGEAGKDFEKSIAMYTELKSITGYKDEGFLGLARVYEAQKEKEKAIAVYEEYLASFLGEERSPRAKQMIQEKINRLQSGQ